MVASSFLPSRRVRKQAISVLYSLAILMQLVLFAACSSPEEASSQINSDNSSGSDTPSITGSLPNIPTGLSATGSNTQVILTWDQVEGASSYTLFWDNATGVSENSSAITGIMADNVTHTGLESSTTYYYKLAAFNALGKGSLSSELSILTVPAKPENFRVAGGNNEVILSWNPVQGATSYTIYWDNASGVESDMFSIVINEKSKAITEIVSDNYTHRGLKSATTYIYRVAAVNTSVRGSLIYRTQFPSARKYFLV